ncbi:ABC transporter substrate-binding protein [Marinobacterium marinum]|uniref:ABC transporter substrate-binding protein n=1 Tax=Marinobacterium marinum TaxID=2756129 RepID=A0A7W1WZM3_9GAMM|nr:ABC transporter substrate-binding protein [Marinobacterium marinum]MBA4503169.1 ABC transporter substrate-binding protein [Marinobacterium marinum]
MLRIFPVWLRLVCILFLLLAQLGCLPSRPLSLTLGTNLWPGYEPLYLARERGLLSADRVLLIELLSASEVMRAFRNGAIDAAALTLDEVIMLRAAGFRPVIVQIADISAGADVIMARPGMTKMADLRGHRVGVEATALGAYLLSRALKLHNMKPEDIEVVRLEVNEHRDAFLRGEVDAVVTFDPVRQQLLEAGAVQVFDSSMLPGEIVDVLVVREALLDSHDDAIQHLIHAWQASLELVRQQPHASASLMARRLKLTPDDIMASYQYLEMPGWQRSRELMGQGEARSRLQQQAERLADSMYQHHLIDELPNLEGLIYSRYPDA